MNTTMNVEKKHSILIVDDSVINIRLLASILDEYHILFATDGESALKLALENQPDLILLDIVMPDMNGYQICEKLKANSLTEKICVIFITGSLINNPFEIGAVDYIRRPFEPPIVKARVKNQIDLKMAHYENLMYAENLLSINEILNDKNIAHKKTSAALSQLKTGLDNLSTGVTIADNDRIVTYVNASGVQLFNKVESKIQRDIPAFSIENLVGMNIDLFHKTPSYQKELLATFQDTVEVNMSLGGHIMNIKASPIFDENGERLGSVAEWRDITEEEGRAAELAKSHAQNALLNKQMNHMQKLESIGRLTSGIAHDFNNILGCIMGYNEMTGYASEDIQDESLRAEIENNTKQVNLAGNRAADLINKMLTYCRQDTPKNQMDNIQPTKIVIQEVLEMLKPALTSRIKIQTSLECEEIIQIDMMDLHQIMTNLVINARDAMQERGCIINVSLRKIINISAHCLACAGVIQGDFIELSVADNGSGIEPEIISRIFDPFFTTKGQGEGTGLGLSTVSGIVHQSNGHILIDSKSTKEHHGTTFRMLFPCDSTVH